MTGYDKTRVFHEWSCACLRRLLMRFNSSLSSLGCTRLEGDSDDKGQFGRIGGGRRGL